MSTEKSDAGEHFGSSRDSLAVMSVMRFVVEELEKAILFQDKMSHSLAEPGPREKARYARDVLRNTKDRVIARILNEADQLSK
jgi:hypothetical protein